MEPRKSVTSIRVITPAEIVSIESKIIVTEITKQQLKIIEKSKAWQDHQKTHKDAKLFMLGAAESSKDLNGVEKALFDTAREQRAKATQEETPQSTAPGQQVSLKLSSSYKSGAEGASGTYHGGHGSVTMAGCDCGQKFKVDEEGNASRYKINTETQAVKTDFGSYAKPKEEHGFSSYKRKTVHEEVETRKYNR